MPVENMSPIEKIAILLAVLPADISSKIIQGFDEKTITDIVSIMYDLKSIKEEDAEKIISEFYEKIAHSDKKINFDIDNIKKLLSLSIGEKKALGIIKSIFKKNPFEVIRNTSIEKLYSVIKNETPIIIAVVVVNLETEKAVELISMFDDEKKKKIFSNMKKVKEIDEETINQIGNAIKELIENTKEINKNDNFSVTVAEIVSFMNREETQKILSFLKEEDPTFYNEVEKKMITFEKIVELDDRLVQKILRSVDQKTLVIALKNAEQKITEKIFKNMTEEAASAITEDMESLGNISEKNIDDARKKIAKIIKKILLEQGVS
ncbi:MAG: hypothetical protein N2446_01905 [Elusimicrobiales bacterium]|nr:hypothetical protein [Elusimicrobiales bacterium]